MPSDATEILPYLYLGSYHDSLRERQSGEFGITHILNVKESCKFFDHDSIEQLHQPLSDFGQTELKYALPACFQFIESARKSGGVSLVHCRSGQNRSAAVVVAYLMLIKGFTLRESWMLISQLRPIVCICEGYCRQLESLEQEFCGESSFSFGELKDQLDTALKQFIARG